MHRHKCVDCSLLFGHVLRDWTDSGWGWAKAVSLPKCVHPHPLSKFLWWSEGLIANTHKFFFFGFSPLRALDICASLLVDLCHCCCLGQVMILKDVDIQDLEGRTQDADAMALKFPNFKQSNWHGSKFWCHRVQLYPTGAPGRELQRTYYLN